MEGLTPMQQALMLMIVGMGTVFVILILIINLSKLMIMVVNRFAPAKIEDVIKAAIQQIAPGAKVTKITKD